MTAPYGPPPHRGEGGWWHWVAALGSEPGWVFCPDPAPDPVDPPQPAAAADPRPFWPWALGAAVLAALSAVAVILLAGR